MSVAITAVPVVANDVQAAPVVANDTQAAPASGVQIDQPLQDFVAQMQANPLGDASHPANPAALATELFGSLRGYLERARSLQAVEQEQMSADDTRGDGGIDTASLAPAGAELHGGPARERLEPVDSGVSASVGVSLAQLRRTMDVALMSMNLSTETALVVRGTSQISNSVNSLLKGQ
jgi:hypothetical protein